MRYKAGEVYKPGATSQDKATCEPCPTGSFMPRDGHQQQQCQQAREKCGDNEYVKENATATANLKCMSHSECTPVPAPLGTFGFGTRGPRGLAPATNDSNAAMCAC